MLMENLIDRIIQPFLSLILIRVIQNVLVDGIEELVQVHVFRYLMIDLVYLDFEYVRKDVPDNTAANYGYFEEVIMDYQHHEEQENEERRI
jgi:hypothetical protein